MSEHIKILEKRFKELEAQQLVILEEARKADKAHEDHLIRRQTSCYRCNHVVFLDDGTIGCNQPLVRGFSESAPHAIGYCGPNGNAMKYCTPDKVLFERNSILTYFINYWFGMVFTLFTLIGPIISYELLKYALTIPSVIALILAITGVIIGCASLLSVGFWPLVITETTRRLSQRKNTTT